MARGLAKSVDGRFILWGDGSLTKTSTGGYIFSPEDPLSADNIEKVLTTLFWGGITWERFKKKPSYMENK